MRRSLLAASSVVALLFAGGASAQPIEGVYIGAAAGANFLDTERLRGLTTTTGVVLQKPGGPINFQTGWAAVGSIGYALGNGVRFELEGNGRSNNVAVTAAAGPNASGSETKSGAMVNVFFDTDIGSRYVFPYFGAGAGYQSVAVKSTGTYDINGSQNSFAYQAMFGLSFPIPGVVGLSATTEFRYLATNGKRRYTGTTAGGTVPINAQFSDNNNFGLLAGLRYAFHVTPPAPPAPTSPAPVAAPAPALARSYLVFFDWDRVDLNDRARQIVAEAAQASKRVADTRIDVAGHADRTGTAAYNLALSRRRAETVAGELVRQGVPAASIVINAFGDTKPLVATGPGQREPQNRRVEIVLK